MSAGKALLAALLLTGCASDHFHQGRICYFNPKLPDSDGCFEWVPWIEINTRIGEIAAINAGNGTYYKVEERMITRVEIDAKAVKP